MKNLLLIFALLICGLGFSQTEVKADISSGDTLVLMSVDDYLQDHNEVTDLYFRHGNNTNWIKLDCGGRDLLKYYLEIDSDEYEVYHVYTRKLNKYYFEHKSNKLRKKNQKEERKAYLKNKTGDGKGYVKNKVKRATSKGEAILSYKVMEKFYAVTLGRL